jgi:hypothetical protein
MNAARDIQDRLAAQGVGSVSVGTETIFDRLPPSPDHCMAVRNIGGPQSDRAMGETTPPVCEHPHVQILARSTTTETLFTLVEAIRTAIDFKTWTSLTGIRHISRFAYEPIDLGEDENGRVMSSVTLELKRLR